MSAAKPLEPRVESELAAGFLGIAAVERDTGLSKDILRIWERRYGFPTPARDLVGDRVYPVEQVQRLRLLKRLIDAGHRPGRVVPASAEDLQALLQAPARNAALEAGPAAADAPLTESVQLCLQLLAAHRLDELRRQLSQVLLREGLGRFVLRLVAPLTTQVGEAWMRGDLEVFEEHIYTEIIQQQLRQAVQNLLQQTALDGALRPRVLLSTLPGEPHGLGLLMVEALLAVEGCQCLSLGVQTPLESLPRAVIAHGSDVLALSFSGLMSAAAVRRGLAELRALLPPTLEIWAGGSGLLQRRPAAAPTGLFCMTDLRELPAAVARWRRQASDR